MASEQDGSSEYQQLGTATFFAPVQPEYLDHIYALESMSYPEDEAATYEKLKFRIENASNVFMVALQSPLQQPQEQGDGQGDTDAAAASAQPQVVGFVCGTCTSAPTLTHESMSKHDPEGSLLCVHSVVVDPSLRRRGLATRMLRAYTGYVAATSPQVAGVRLICKQDLIRLYEGAGFRLLGPSDVVHGKDPWYDMALEL